MKVHMLQAGRLIGNRTFMRGEGWSAFFRRSEIYEFPAFVYIVEHPEGPIAIDTGMSSQGWKTPPPTPRFIPKSDPAMGIDDEIGPRMRARGLDPESISRVILTHLDPDHVGGVGHFPNAEVLVHRPEHEFASTFMGRQRYQPRLWPHAFAPKPYDLDGPPEGPFPASKAITDSGDVRLVAIPGHSVGQIGVTLLVDDVTLFFVADHMLSQAWFLEDLEAERTTMVSKAGAPKRAAETTRRIRQFVEERPCILLPAHDTEASARLEALQPLAL